MGDSDLKRMADEIERLRAENAMLRAALEDVSTCNSHYGAGPHCTCSQREREGVARAALKENN